jgi:hypothetical protein
LLFSAPLQGLCQEDHSAPGWERSIVTIEVSRKQYDYYQPWTKRTRRVQKIGSILADHQILATADEMFDRTLIRVQKGGRGHWFVGELVWVDYHANLALITVPEEGFWKGLEPVTFSSAHRNPGRMNVLRWREGKLETRTAEFTQFSVREGQLSPVSSVIMEAGSEIQGVGWGEPLVVNSNVVGLIWAQDGRNCIAMPASTIQSILGARKQGSYRGLGYFHFLWQPAENPATLSRLKLSGDPRGVIITEVPSRPDSISQVLKRHDILLRISGFDLDIQGDYDDPEFGHLMLENLSTRQVWAGDDIKMQIWRDGREVDVTYRLPGFEYTNSLVPNANYDKEPEYFMIGGLVFEPLTVPYLQSWGTDWKRRSPFRLSYYHNESPTKDRPALVVLSQVLPDAYNIGYQDQKGLIVSKVNGQPVHRLSELRDALARPSDDVHLFEFARGDGLRRMVVAAGEPERAATASVLKRYGIAEPFRLDQKPAR